MGNVADPRWWIGLSCVTAVWSSFFLGWWSRNKIDISNMWKAQNVGMYTNTSRVDDLALNAAGEASRKQTVTWRRMLSLSVSLLLLFVVLRVDYVLLAWQTSNDLWLVQQHAESAEEELHFLWAQYYALIPTISKAICINIFGVVFGKITNMQVAFEAHINPIQKRNSHVLKLCTFHFVSNFLYLYYYAFVEGDLKKLKFSLYTVLIVSLVVQNFTESGLPWLITRIGYVADTQGIVYRKSTNVYTLKRSKMRLDYEKAEYEGTFFDFLELFIQYGQVTLFASVFPLGALLALLNNCVEQRSDVYKILHELNPKLPCVSSGFVQTSDKGSDESYSIIDVWVGAFHVISYLAVATNIALLAMDDTLQDNTYVSKLNMFHGGGSTTEYTWAETCLVLFAIEHVMFVLKWFLSYLLEHDEVENTNTNPQKHFADAALYHHDLASVSSKYDANGSAEFKIHNHMQDILDDTVKRNVMAIVKQQEKRIEMAEKVRDEAIAWAGEVVPSEVIETHLRNSITPRGKVKKNK